MVNDITKAFRLRDGISFDGDAFILTGDIAPTDAEMPEVPIGSMYLRVGNPSGVFQLKAEGWVGVGSDDLAIADLNALLDTANADIDAIEARLDINEGDIDSLEGRMDTAEADITSAEANIAANTSAIITNGTNISGNAVGITANVGEISTTKSRVSSAEANIVTAQGNIAANNTYTRNVEIQVEANDADIVDLTNSIAQTDNTVAQLSLNKADITYVDGKIADVVGNAPAALDTLNEIALALADDDNAIAAINATLATKAPLTTTDDHESRIVTLEAKPDFDPTYLENNIATNVTNINTNISAIANNTAEIDAAKVRVTTAEGEISTIKSDATALTSVVQSNVANVNSLATRMNDAENEISDTQDEVANNNDEIADIDARVEVLEDKPDFDPTYLETDIDALQAKDTSLEAADVALQSQIDILGSTKANITYVDDRFTDLIGTSPVELDTLQELAAALNNDANAVNAMNVQIADRYRKSETDALLAGKTDKTTTTALTGRVQVLEDKPDFDPTPLQNQITSNDNDIASNEVRISAAEAAIVSNDTELTALDGRQTTTETNVSGLTGRMVTAESDIDSLEARATAVEAKASTNESDITALKSEQTVQNNRLTAAESDMTAVEDRATILESEVSTLGTTKADVAYVDTKISDLIANAPEELDTLNELATALADDQNAINAINTSLANRYTKAEADTLLAGKTNVAITTALEGRVQTLEDTPGFDPTSLQNQITANATAILGLDTGLDNAAASIADNDADIADLQSRVTTTETDIDTAEANIQTNVSRIQTNKTDIAINATGIADNVSDIATLKTEMIAAQSNISSAQARLTTNESSIASLNATIVTKADTSYVDTKLQELIDAAPEELDTLRELAEALTDNGDAITAINATMATKASIRVTNDHEARIIALEVNPPISQTDLDNFYQAVVNYVVYSIENIEMPDISGKADITYVDAQIGSIQSQIDSNDAELADIASWRTGVDTSLSNVVSGYTSLHNAQQTDIDDHEDRITDLENGGGSGGDGSWNWFVYGIEEDEDYEGRTQIFKVRYIEDYTNYYLTVRAPIVMEFRGVSGFLYMHNSLEQWIRLSGHDTGNKNKMDDDWPCLYNLLPGEYRVQPKRDGTLLMALYSYCGYPEITNWTDTDWHDDQIRDNGVFRWNGKESRGEDKGSI